jgi:hypothetical protein
MWPLSAKLGGSLSLTLLLPPFSVSSLAQMELPFTSEKIVAISRTEI